MPDTLLIIDGRGRPDALIGALEAAGYFCVYARGPLKARALLKEHPVALIVWKDNTGNADLSADLARVWGSHPHVPVVHLVAHAMRAAAAGLGPQVRAMLPVEAAEAELLAAVRRALPPGRNRPSELDVLGAAAARRGPPAGERPAARVSPVRELTPAIAVSLDERQSLTGRPVAAVGATGLLGRVWTRLLRGRT